MIGGKLPLIAVFAAFLAALSASPALAGDDFYTARAEGLGRATLADPYGNTTLSTNPGMMGILERYYFHGAYRIGPTSDMEWSFSALDARTAPVAFGIAYRGTFEKPPITLDEMPGFIVPGEEIPEGWARTAAGASSTSSVIVSPVTWGRPGGRPISRRLS